MNARGTLGLGCLLVGLVATSAACSTTTRVAPVSPAVAFSASRSDVEQGCSIDGTPRVIATRVMPMRGITAAVSGGRVWLRFATVRDPRVLLAIDPETLDVVTDAAPPVEVAPDEETALAANAPAFEGSVFGRPAIAFDTNGKGVLAFIESNDTGFQVVVTRASRPAL